MTIEEYQEALTAAMSAYEDARREEKPYQVEVKVDPVVYEPPVSEVVIMFICAFIIGLCLGALIWRRK